LGREEAKNVVSINLPYERVVHGAHGPYALFLIFSILQFLFIVDMIFSPCAFFSILGYNFTKLFCFQTFVVIHSLVPVTSMMCLALPNHMNCTIKDSKHIWNCQVKEEIKL